MIKKKIWRMINILIILALIVSFNFIKNSRYTIPFNGNFVSSMVKLMK